MNRRTAFAALAALPAVASGAIVDDQPPSGKLYVADLLRPDPLDPASFDFPRTPKEVACQLAHWELWAMRDNPELGNHVCCGQWSKDAVAFIGCGNDLDWLTDRAARVMAMFCYLDEQGETVSDFQMAAYRTPCGRAFCLVIDGVLTDDCREEFRRPLWRTGPWCGACS